MFLINAFEPPRAFDLHTGEFILIGRGEHCDIKLDDPSASRVHCRVLARDGRVLLTDAGSRWGTFVNGKRVSEAELAPGDRVRVGETLLTVSAESDAKATTIAPKQDSSFHPVSPDLEHYLDDPTTSREDLRVRSQLDESPHFVSQPAQAAFTDNTFVPSRFVGTQFLRYQIENLIAHSRTGMAFLANDPALQRKVVLKVYRPDLLNEDRSVARFLRAVRTMIHFRHPNIVRLFDAGESDRLCYTISEYIDADTGSEFIRNLGIAGMLDWQTTVRIGRDIAEALSELHAQGVVHRDIRPSHILITRDHSRALIGEVVLAKAWDRVQVEQVTAADDIVGDLAWQSPEQLGNGEPVDHRSDLYQLGLTLYTLLTGRTPFAAGNPADLIEAILNTAPTSPKSIQLSIPDLLSDAVLRVLSKRPGDRPQNANELKADLERVQRFTQ